LSGVWREPIAPGPGHTATTQRKRRYAMRSYEVCYEVVGAGAGVVREVVTAASDFNARRLIEAKYQGLTVRIYNVSTLG